MISIEQGADYVREGRATFAAIGTFDGVHRGHQEVIGSAVRAARAAGGRSAVITFDRHPASVFAPDRAPPMLLSLEQKRARMEALGADTLLTLPFNEDMCRLPALDFARLLAQDLDPLAEVYVGGDFTYGYRRLGNVDTLKAHGDELGFVAKVVPPCMDGERPVSSTRIREAVLLGDLETARRLLGYPVEVSGVVAQGDALGRKIGFPTANLDSENRAIPAKGVYAARARWDRSAWRSAVVNIGTRPTVDRSATVPRIEAHILDFEGDLYGRRLDLRFHHRLRPEERFPSLEALKSAIAQDTTRARAVLAQVED